LNPFSPQKEDKAEVGLGLHIVYNLVTRKLKGTIQCESRLGAGTKFVIKVSNTEV
jgi:signal transduction histidine kinase